MQSKTFLKGLLAASALTAFSIGSASAAGTAAETSVANTFSLDYSVGGVDQPPIDTGPGGTNTPTLFTVDRLVDLTLSSNGDNAVAPGAVAEELTFTLTNDGNDTQAYIFDLVNENEAGAPATEFDASNFTITYYVGNSATGTPHTYDPTTDLTTLNVPADGQLFVVVTGDIPTVGALATLDNGDIADVTLIADTVEPNAGPADKNLASTQVVADSDGVNDVTGAAENVLADGEADAAPTNSPYDNENANDGAFSATGQYLIASADLVAEKTVYVFSEDGTGCGGAISLPSQELPTGFHDVPTNGFHAIPGACVEYRITAVNSGTTADANAVNLDIVDVLPTDLRFVQAAQDGFTNVNFTTPAGNADCGAVTCTVRAVSQDPTTTSTTSNLDFNTNGVIVIRALVK